MGHDVDICHVLGNLLLATSGSLPAAHRKLARGAKPALSRAKNWRRLNSGAFVMQPIS